MFSNEIPFNAQDGSKSQQLTGGDGAMPFPIFSDPVPIYSDPVPIYSDPVQIYTDPVSQNKKTETLGVSHSTRVLKEKTVTEAAAAATVETKPRPAVVPEVVVSYSVQVMCAV